MSRGRLEAQITIPTGGWTVAITITAIGGPYNVTVAAGTYYPTDLLTSLQTGLNAASGSDGSFTVTASWGEAGTGLVTIAHTVQTVSFTWTSTDLRDALGYEGDMAAASSHLAEHHSRGVWLPDCEMAAKYGPYDEGHIETDMGQTISPRGDVHSMLYTTRTFLPSVMWSHVTRTRARVRGEFYTAESFEQWWRDTQGGELSYFEPCAPVRLYWSADAGVYHTYRLTGRTSTTMERSVADWCGLFPIEIAGYRVPGT